MDHDKHSGSQPFWRSMTGVAFIGFLAVGAFLLVAEHGAHIFAGYWILWLLPLVCLGMHFLHGGHGHSGSHDRTGSKGQ